MSTYSLSHTVVVHVPSPFLSDYSSLLFREVSTEEGEKKAKALGAMFIETSVETGLNIENVSVSTKVVANHIFSVSPILHGLVWSTIYIQTFNLHRDRFICCAITIQYNMYTIAG